jgi:hypothetical protein
MGKKDPSEEVPVHKTKSSSVNGKFVRVSCFYFEMKCKIIKNLFKLLGVWVNRGLNFSEPIKILKHTKTKKSKK